MLARWGTWKHGSTSDLYLVFRTRRIWGQSSSVCFRENVGRCRRRSVDFPEGPVSIREGDSAKPESQSTRIRSDGFSCFAYNTWIWCYSVDGVSICWCIWRWDVHLIASPRLSDSKAERARGSTSPSVKPMQLGNRMEDCCTRYQATFKGTER